MTDQNTAGQSPNHLPTDRAEQSKLREKVLGLLMDKLKPWLLEFGNWMFGGLIAFTLVILPLLIVTPVDTALVTAAAIFACALPLDVVGLFTLKLIKDMNSMAINDVMKQAFDEANIPSIEAYTPLSDEPESTNKQRIDIGLRYVGRLAAVCATLTLLGMTVALWHMAWWVAVIFVLMIILSLAMTVIMTPRLLRPVSEDAYKQRKQFRDQNNAAQRTAQ